MAIRLVALDLDDTLLDPALKISAECSRAIRQVHQRGIIVTISTGRMYRSAVPYALELELAVPLITYEGALVKHSRSGEILYSKPLPSLLARPVMSYFKQEGVHFHTYYDDLLVMEALSAEGRAYAQLAGVEPHLSADLISDLDRHQAMKIMAISHQEGKLEQMELDLQARFGPQLHITRSKPYFLEVMHPQADKAQALQLVARHLGIERREVMAVGDSYNDLEMIAWAGIGVAMGNADPVIKAQADFVTTSNQEEGVTRALQRFILRAG
jgi:Cof subfamily protein (haloacid dehalogenase superfamily)